jgi:hypothetical protein
MIPPVAIVGFLTEAAFRENRVLFFIIGYFLVFALCVFGFATWRVKRLRVRPPIEFKLLRGPGETLRRQMAAYDENALYRMGGAAFAPLLIAGALLLAWGTWFKPTTNTQAYFWLGSSAVLLLVCMVFAFRWALKDFYRYRNNKLGYLGERAVGEALAPLAGQGYHVFHDIPASSGKKRFNIDHAVVGPTGLFAIETKTRRKGRAREGYEEHKVAYDGKRLDWPWGDDNFGLRQAEERANWLSEELDKIPKFGIPAKPVLVLPGWYVVPKGFGPVAVLNQKQLVAYITKPSVSGLTPEQVGTLARELDAMCREVED